MLEAIGFEGSEGGRGREGRGGIGSEKESDWW